jgi:hypothetical protein
MFHVIEELPSNDPLSEVAPLRVGLVARASVRKISIA